VNGTQVGSQARSGSIASSSNQLQIGGDGIYGQYFAGSIDDVRVYNTTLAASDIQADMNLPVGSGGSSDTQPPTTPGTLTATAVSSSQINLSWGVSTDNVGVTGIRIDRCQGVGCTNFSHLVQLQPPVTTYSDTGLTGGTSYSYQVRAMDGAGNISPPTNSASATTQATPGPDLVASYSFDEGSGTTVADSSGNGNNGTIANATWTTSGKFGGALSFNGTNARVDVPDSTSLHLATGMTLEAWVNPASPQTKWQDVIYKGNDNYYLEGSSTNGGAPAGGGTFGGAGATAFGGGALPAGTWTYLAATYDGSNIRVYVNGTLMGTQAKTGTIASSSNQLQIGGDGIFSQYFGGIIDEVRVYDAALTAAQIQSDMNSGLTVPSVPTNLTATVVSSTQVNLSWGASSDAAGVTGYRVERCQGAGCSSFAQIAAPTGTSYNDTGLTANTSYSYRVRAIDAAGKLGPYSSVVTAFTGLLVSPRNVALTPGQTQQYTASVPGGGSPPVTWSVDGVAGGSSSVGTITSGGLYTAPSTAGSHTVAATAQDQSASGGATAYTSDYAGMFTYHDDNLRTGQNLGETVLTPANVSSSTFGKLFSLPLDGIAYAAPLYVENVAIPNKGTHNVVYVATEHDSVYAYDADGQSSTPLWKDSFINPANGVTTVSADDVGECCDIAPEIGITSTPVIDKSTNTMYVVVKTKEVSGGTTNYVQRLHALDLTTGAEKLGGPVVIQATVPGTGIGSTNGQLAFNSLRENQRTGLLLVNGVVYFGFASHGDNQPYHGWIFGYNASTLQRTLAFCVTPNQEGAGVWMSGDGIASDSTGSLYYITGDGEFDGNTGGPDWGDSYIRMTPAGVVSDYFTPSNQDALNAGNHDLGSGGALLLPDQPGAHPHEMLSSGKDGSIYLVDRDNMGHYSTSTNNIVQTVPNAFPNGQPEPGNFTAPVYFNGYVFFGPTNDTLQAFKLTNGLLSTSATFRSAVVFGERGASMAASANGSSNGILWAVQRNDTSPGVLYAYDPTNSSNGTLNEIYDSSQAGSRDTLDAAAKFNPPTIANGKVFVAGVSQLTVYGLLP
jgi:fibronectin type 3 domain-containing protein